MRAVFIGLSLALGTVAIVATGQCLDRATNTFEAATHARR